MNDQQTYEVSHRLIMGENNVPCVVAVREDSTATHRYLDSKRYPTALAAKHGLFAYKLIHGIDLNYHEKWEIAHILWGE